MTDIQERAREAAWKRAQRFDDTSTDIEELAADFAAFAASERERALDALRDAHSFIISRQWNGRGDLYWCNGCDAGADDPCKEDCPFDKARKRICAVLDKFDKPVNEASQ